MSVQGNYTQEGMVMEENYTHDCQAHPMPHIHPGIKHEHDSGTENVDNKIRRQIFKEI